MNPVTEPRMTRAQLLELARTGEPGWSAHLGGPRGVALLAEQLRREALAEAEDLMGLRTAGMLMLLQDESLAEVGRIFGVTRQAIYKIQRHAQLPPWLRRLASQQEDW